LLLLKNYQWNLWNEWINGVLFVSIWCCCRNCFLCFCSITKELCFKDGTEHVETTEKATSKDTSKDYYPPKNELSRWKSKSCLVLWSIQTCLKIVLVLHTRMFPFPNAHWFEILKLTSAQLIPDVLPRIELYTFGVSFCIHVQYPAKFP
jgi:hypothetical protein